MLIQGRSLLATYCLYQIQFATLSETTFYFHDAHAFQQLFTAVAELCGLTGKMAATTYTLLDIDAVDEDDDEEA